MLGKTKTGRGFKGTVEYCLQQKKDPEILYANNIVNDEKKHIINEFVALSSHNENISKPVWHSSIAFANEDNITDKKMIEIANRFMEKAGFDTSNNQWLIIKHNDTNHKHCHIIGNRVGFDGQTVNDYYFKSRTVQWAKELEKEYKLTEVQKIANKNRLEKSLKYDKKEFKELIDKTLSNKNIKSFEDFQNALKKQGVDINIVRHKTTGKAYGVSFTNGTKTFKGSDLSKKLAFKALNSALPIPSPALQVLRLSTKIISKGIQQGL